MMKFMNVTDPQASKTWVESMVKAGLPAEPSDYVKPWMLERLNKEEIKNLLFGSTITGMGFYSGKQWQWDIDNGGAFKTRGGGFGDESGSMWLEKDFLIWNLPKNTEGLDNKAAVFRNREGVKETSNEYVFASVWALMPFSVEKRLAQSSP